MTGQSVNLVFKRVSKMLNLPELDPEKISGHSARVGVTQDLVEDGAPGTNCNPVVYRKLSAEVGRRNIAMIAAKNRASLRAPRRGAHW